MSNYELEFVQTVCPSVGIPAQINPEKVKNPYAPDLIVDGGLADLKYQSAPFFSAGKYYGFDPQYTVVFNHKDYERYSRHYPHLTVFFWVQYEPSQMQIGGQAYKVDGLRGIWRAPFSKIARIIEAGHAPLHQYRRRVNDELGNAKSSYLFHLMWFDCLAQSGPGNLFFVDHHAYLPSDLALAE